MNDILEHLNPVWEPSFYGTPSYEDAPPEPDIPVGAVIHDREGMGWVRDVDGWCVFGDKRPQKWSEVAKWF